LELDELLFDYLLIVLPESEMGAPHKDDVLHVFVGGEGSDVSFSE
jgi:hypothetical protein